MRNINTLTFYLSTFTVQEMQKQLQKSRCSWGELNPLMIKYHDTQWGVPVHSDRKLFEFLLLDGFQAGLNWATILNKRAHFRNVFDRFDAQKIARYSRRKIAALMKDPGIIRNRLKIEGAVKNAQAFLAVQKKFGSFDSYIWRFVGGSTIRNKWRSLKDIPAKTRVSDAMSKDLKKRGFTFVGSTICYAFMQAAGLVNDHTTTCFRYKEVR